MVSLRYIVLDVLRIRPQSDCVMSNHTKPAIADAELSAPVTIANSNLSAKNIRSKMDLHLWAMIDLSESEGEPAFIARAIDWHGGCIKKYAVKLTQEYKRKREGC